VDAAIELLRDELASDLACKRVVFCHHREVAARLEAELAEFGVVAITGEASPVQRTQRVATFQASPATRVAVCQIVAGGVGITLTAAHHVTFVEQSFVPGDNAQAADRCHRIGQTMPVIVRVLAAAGSVDTLVSEILARKARMIRETLA
jgi:SWI/SNF-related matrix-associated actin-dependent regulator 1 of chromatin subfamily A